MIGPGSGARVYLACGATDMRKGILGLAALAQEVLRQQPASGAVFAFRGRRGDRIKLLHWDGQGFCLYYKVLEKGLYVQIEKGTHLFFNTPTVIEAVGKLQNHELEDLDLRIGQPEQEGHQHA
jgi:transposase